jgi:hypothetical protein
MDAVKMKLSFEEKDEYRGATSIDHVLKPNTNIKIECVSRIRSTIQNISWRGRLK